MFPKPFQINSGSAGISWDQPEGNNITLVSPCFIVVLMKRGVPDQWDQEVCSEADSAKNSKPKGALQPAWCFTWHDYPEDWKELFADRQSLLQGYIIGEEICPKTERPHLQGWLDFGKKRGRWSMLKLPTKINWEKARGTAEENYTYCTKDGKYVLYGTGEAAKPKVKYTVDLELSPWQSRLAKILAKEPDPRTVYWVWEPFGKAGKTLFQKWWCCHNMDTLILSGKASDMKNGVITWIADHKEPPRVILCNIPKSTEERFVSFTGLEEVKDMLFYSGKYEGGMVNGKPPHLVIFANWKPDTAQMSGDRWRIIRIPDGKGAGEPIELDWTGPLDNFIE